MCLLRCWLLGPPKSLGSLRLRVRVLVQGDLKLEVEGLGQSDFLGALWFRALRDFGFGGFKG